MAVAYLQRIASQDSAAGTTHTVNVVADTQTGSTILLAIETAGAAAVTSVSDSRGNTWVVDRSSSNTASGVRAHIARGLMTAPLLNGDTITVNLGASQAGSEAAYEYRGLLTPTPTDTGAQGNTQSSATTIASGNTAALAVANELVVTVLADANSGSTAHAASGYTVRDSGRGRVDLADQTAGSQTAKSATWTWTGSAASSACVVQTYKPSLSLPAPPPNRRPLRAM